MSVVEGRRRVAARAWRGPAVTAAVVGLGTLVVAVRDPHVSGSYGFCPLFAATGWYCPACGCLRATHDLVHGDVASAWSSNPLWVLTVPALVGLWAWWVVRAGRGRPGPALPAWSAWGFFALVVVFGVVRNLPGLDALAP